MVVNCKMLSERNIDDLMMKIMDNNSAYIYYIAHMVECNEGIIDELMYKSKSSFNVVEIKVNNIVNALFEKENFENHPEEYDTEIETYITNDKNIREIKYYVPRNITNPRIPHIIYGYTETNKLDAYDGRSYVHEYPSVVKTVYTNALRFSDKIGSEAIELYNDNKLNWKYKKLDNFAEVDGIQYFYKTSDWYILDVEGFSRTEKPLININQKTAYFMSAESAHSFLNNLLI